MPKHLIKQLHNNFEKVQKTTFLTPQNHQNEQFFDQHFRFWGNLSTFWLKMYPKVGLLRSRKMPKHFLNNPKNTFKSPENDFFDLKNGQITDVNMAKKCRWLNFWSTSSKIAFLVPQFLKKRFPL